MQTSTRPSAASLLVGLLALLCSGCLEFDKQTMLVTFPKEGNGLRVLMVYHGLRVSGSNPQHLQKAKEQLTQLVRREAFYVGDPLARVYLKPGKDDQPKDWDVRAMKVLNKHVVLGQGVFITGKDNHYSFCQPLTVRDPDPFLAWLNKIIGEEVVDMILDDGKKDKKGAASMDEQTKKMIKQAAQEKFPFLRLEPGRIALTIPGSRKFFTDVKKDLAGGHIAHIKEEVEKLLAKETRDMVNVDLLRKTFDAWQSDANLLGNMPWSLDQRSNQITVALGWGEGQPFHLTLETGRRASETVTPEKQQTDLRAFAQTLGAPFRDDVTIDQVLDEFERTQVLVIPAK